MATRCLVPAELIVQSLEGPTVVETGSRAQRHLTSCAACRADVASVREGVADLRALATLGAAEGACLQEPELAALVDDRMPRHQRASAVVHLARCGRCRRELAGIRRLMADDRVAAELTTVTPNVASTPKVASRRAHVWRVVGVGVAAALAVVVFRSGSPSRNEGEGLLRDEAITVAPAPQAQTPAGVVSDASRLRWTAVSGSHLYQVTIFDAEGVVVWQSETADTTVAVPVGVHLGRDVRLVWRVQARVGFDRWLSSALTPFVITGAGRLP